MAGALRAIARFFEKNIGWNRIGVLLSLTIGKRPEAQRQVKRIAINAS